MQHRSTPLLSIVGLLACGPGEDQSLDRTYDPCETIVVTSDNATEAELASIRDGLTMWNEVAGARLELGPAAGAQQLRIFFETSAPMFFGLYRDEEGDIVVNRALEDHSERSIVVAHEVGHAMGLWHVDRDQRVSVMNEANITTRPNGGDVAKLAETWGFCPMQIDR